MYSLPIERGFPCVSMYWLSPHASHMEDKYLGCIMLTCHLPATSSAVVSRYQGGAIVGEATSDLGMAAVTKATTAVKVLVQEAPSATTRRSHRESGGFRRGSSSPREKIEPKHEDGDECLGGQMPQAIVSELSLSRFGERSREWFSGEKSKESSLYGPLVHTIRNHRRRSIYFQNVAATRDETLFRK